MRSFSMYLIIVLKLKKRGHAKKYPGLKEDRSFQKENSWRTAEQIKASRIYESYYSK